MAPRHAIFWDEGIWETVCVRILPSSSSPEAGHKESRITPFSLKLLTWELGKTQRKKHILLSSKEGCWEESEWTVPDSFPPGYCYYTLCPPMFIQDFPPFVKSNIKMLRLNFFGSSLPHENTLDVKYIK